MITTLTISAGSGDCWCNKPAIGTFDATSGTLNVGGEGSIGDEVSTWIPFRVPLGQGKQIASAALRVICIGGSVGDPAIILGCEDADNPSTPTDLTDLRARVMTSAQYAINAITEAVGTERDYDVTLAVQEVLDRAGWTHDNTMAVYIQDAVSGSAQFCQWASFENATYNEPKLVITFAGGFIPRGAWL